MFKPRCRRLKDWLVKGRLPVREKERERKRGRHKEDKQIFSLKNRYNLLKWLLILLWLWYVWRAALQTVWHSSLIMEFWMNNVLCMHGNNGCEVLHLFLQHVRLLPLTCSLVFLKFLPNTGQRQLCGPTTVSPLKIPLIIIPPFPPSTFGWGKYLALFSQPLVLTVLLVLVVFDVIWQYVL